MHAQWQKQICFQNKQCDGIGCKKNVEGNGKKGNVFDRRLYKQSELRLSI
jgi:hypothetical protein